MINIISLPFLLNIILSGILLGGLYALIAFGLSLVFGVMGIINIAHGELLIMGSYIAYWLFRILGIHPFLGLIVAAVSVGLIGLLMQRFLIQPVFEKNPFNTLILCFGLSIILQNVMLYAWGGWYRTLLLPEFSSSIWIGGVSINMGWLLIFIFSLLIMFIVYLWLRKTTLGTAIRAAAQDRDAASLMGINVRLIYMLTFFIGAALAAVCGSFYVCIYDVHPWAGPTVKAFIITVIGGAGSFSGALLGGVILGLTESLSTLIIPAAYKDVIGLLMFIIVLLIRPQGLFGRG